MENLKSLEERNKDDERIGNSVVGGIMRKTGDISLEEEKNKNNG